MSKTPLSSCYADRNSKWKYRVNATVSLMSKKGTWSKGKQVKFACHLSFPAEECYDALRSMMLLKAHLLSVQLKALYFQGLYFPPTHNKRNKKGWNEIAKSNKSHCCSFKHEPHFLLHLNAAEDRFLLQWWKLLQCTHSTRAKKNIQGVIEYQ